MMPDELAKHGLRVTPLNIDDDDVVWRMNLNSRHQENICDCLEPIAPPDVAQADPYSERICPIGISPESSAICSAGVCDVCSDKIRVDLIKAELDIADLRTQLDAALRAIAALPLHEEPVDV